MDLRYEAILMLENRGAVLDTARAVSSILRDHRIDGAVIGGVAVFLHGYARTTRDVDVLVRQPLEDVCGPLEASGARFDPARKEFSLGGVPVQLVPASMVVPEPGVFVERDGIITLDLHDLIAVKLRTGTGNLARAQDIADVVGLIRHHNLGKTFAARLHPSVRKEFRKLVDAVRRQG